MDSEIQIKCELTETDQEMVSSRDIHFKHVKVEPNLSPERINVIDDSPAGDLDDKNALAVTASIRRTIIEYDCAIVKSEIEVDEEKFEEHDNAVSCSNREQQKKQRPLAHPKKTNKSLANQMHKTNDSLDLKRSERSMECYLCQHKTKTFRIGRFKDHMRIHTGETPFQCVSCSMMFSSTRKLLIHMKYHPDQTLNCTICRRKFTKRSDLANHEKECVLKRRYECYACRSVFSYLSSLRRHMPHHTGKMIFNCKFCHKGYTRKEYFVAHMQNHSDKLPFKCDNCELVFEDRKTKCDHFDKCIKKKQFQCEACGYSTISKISAENHKRMHTGDDEFACWHCSKVFLLRSEVLQHVNKVHKRKPLFECIHCHKTYHRWTEMDIHTRNCSKKKS